MYYRNSNKGIVLCFENISNNLLWKTGNYDEAVLSEMGLKFDENGVIVKC